MPLHTVLLGRALLPLARALVPLQAAMVSAAGHPTSLVVPLG